MLEEPLLLSSSLVSLASSRFNSLFFMEPRRREERKEKSKIQEVLFILLEKLKAGLEEAEIFRFVNHF